MHTQEADPSKWRAAGNNGEVATQAQLGRRLSMRGRFARYSEAAKGSQECICRYAGCSLQSKGRIAEVRGDKFVLPPVRMTNVNKVLSPRSKQ